MKRQRFYECGRLRRDEKLEYQSLEHRYLLASLSVTTFEDVVDSNDSVLSLREAINIANNNLEDDEIVLGSGVYAMSIQGFGEDLGFTGDFDILPDGEHSVAFIGQGMQETTIDAGGLDRVFQVHSKSKVTFADLAITGGKTLAAFDSGTRGAGIWSGNSLLALKNVAVFNNQALDRGVGGGLWIAGGEFSVTGCSINSNSAGENGTAVFVRQAKGKIILSEFTSNFVSDDLLDLTYSNRRGAIFIFGSNVDFGQCRIDKNEGVGIAAIQSELDCNRVRFFSTLPSVVFPSNGIGLLAFDSGVNVKDCRFVRNEVCGISVHGNASALTVNGSVFLENQIGLFFDGPTLDVMGSTFDGSISSSDGFTNDSDEGIVVANVPLQLNPVALIRIAGMNVSHCTFSDHQRRAIYYSNGVFPSQVTLDDLTITNNQTIADGTSQTGAIELHAENITITNSTIRQTGRAYGILALSETFEFHGSSISESLGCGLVLNASNARIFNSRIVNNFNDWDQGAGIYFDRENSNLLIANCEISGNRAARDAQGFAGHGGALVIGSRTATVRIISTTIAKNSATGSGGAIWVAETIPESETSVEIINSILWGNHAPNDPILSGPNEFSVSYCDIQDADPNDSDIPFGGSANHNIDDNPRFVAWAIGNYRLRSSSPAIDVGNSAAIPPDEFDVDNDNDTLEPTPDLDLFDRIVGVETDLGCFEFGIRF